MTDVLVVDDDPDIREAVADVLAGEGFSVQTANNGREALTLIEGDDGPRLMLLDLMMPVMSGAELLEELRAAESRLPIVIMSAFASEHVEGAQAVLRKPVSLVHLLRTVHGFLHS
jgi:CheY-like chemotaxis protein